MTQGMQHKPVNISLSYNLITFWFLLSDLLLKELSKEDCVWFEGRVCRYQGDEQW